MHCDQCGKENRPGSNFCRHCGQPFSVGMIDTWSARLPRDISFLKKPATLVLAAIILAAPLFWGGSKAYAYFQVESTINTAKKLQNSSDYKASIDALDGLENRTVTNGQKNRIAELKSNNEKFITYKALLDNAITVEQAASKSKSASSDALQSALKDLQSIEGSYPELKSVQDEITKIQKVLVTILQDEASANKRAAAAARAERDRAEANAQQAQRAADSATANAAAQAETARAAEVEKSFYNQLLSAYNNLRNGDNYYTEAMNYLNAGNDSSAIVIFAKGNAVYSEVSRTATNLNSTFSGLPQAYVNAASNLATAANYNIKATNSALDGISGNSTAYNTNYYSNLGDQYRDLVGTFLRSYASN